jgi:hypothetical protein
MLGPKTPVPWFELHMGICNSLFGCRRQVYKANEVLRKDSQKERNYLGNVPESVPLGTKLPEGSILHFLVPDKGMVAACNDKVAKELAKENCAKMAAWYKAFVSAPWSKEEVKALEELTQAAEVLWERYTEKRREAVQATARYLPVWGQPTSNGREGEQDSGLPGMAQKWTLSLEECEAIRDRLLEQSRSTRKLRLRLAMDAWCALWVWPIENARELPSRAEWISGLRTVLSGESNVVDVDELVKKPGHRWFQQVIELGEHHKFFHWELHFAELFRDRGGFDLMVGNPPWVKYEWSEEGILSEFDPTIGIRNVSASDMAKRRGSILNESLRKSEYLKELWATLGVKSYFNARQAYPVLQGVQTNLYKCFLTKSWQVCSPNGVTGLLHQPAIFDDPNGEVLREAFYRRLILAAVFVNELKLFAEIGNCARYAFSVCHARPEPKPDFRYIGNLYHPRTIDDSVRPKAKGGVVTPGIKTNDGHWELNGHQNRIVHIEEHGLEVFSRLFDSEGTPPIQARLPIVHSAEMMRILERFEDVPKLRDKGGEWFDSEMWHETNRQKDGTIRREDQICKQSRMWIVSGPHFHIGTPFNKTPNQGCKNKQDYVRIDLTTIPDDYLPRTLYVPGCLPKEYVERTPKWNGRLTTDFYRHVHRKMLAITGERTYIPTIIPPGAGHIDAVFSVAFGTNLALAIFSGLSCALVIDFFVRSTGKQALRADVLQHLPCTAPLSLIPAIILRTLRLNCLTTHYADLWEDLWQPAFKRDGFTKPDRRLTAIWNQLTAKWSRNCALRTDYERRQALVELDALAALSLGISIDELCTVYRVQFPVLNQYEREKRYDQNGRLVPPKVVKLAKEKELTRGSISHPDDPSIEYTLPFDGCDREQDMRLAYAVFAERYGPQIAPIHPSKVKAA